MICSGIGEIMSPATPLKDCFIVIGKGSGGISTAEAYEKIDRLELSERFNYLLYDGRTHLKKQAETFLKRSQKTKTCPR